MDISAIVRLIPDPPFINLQDILNLVTCPITPLAFVRQQDMMDPNDPTKFTFVENTNVTNRLNPAYQWNNYIKPMLKRKAEQVKALWNDILTYFDTINWTSLQQDIQLQFNRPNPEGDPALVRNVIQDKNAPRSVIGKYLRMFFAELERITSDPIRFGITLSMAIASNAAVRAVCPEIYSNSAYPFQALDTELTTFSYSGIIPTNFDPAAQILMNAAAQAYQKVLLWQTVPALLVV